MHSIKASWVGQTFALAKCNESEGRRTRIRRSKEERKAMVQDFIKKYQKSNNGSFPSLNLTHKEVGGSFYTVREIVRDLIQENRVLSPGKLALEDQGIDQMFKQDAFDSDASDSQAFLTISSIGSHVVPTDLQVSNGIPLSHESSINGSQIDVLRNDSDEVVHIESLVNESNEAEEHSEALLSSLATDSIVEKEKHYEGSVITIATDLTVEKEKNGEQESKAAKNPVGSDVVVETETNTAHDLKVTTARINPLVSDVVVETFPLRVVTNSTDILDLDSEELMKMTGSLEDLEIEELVENDEVSGTKITLEKSFESMGHQTATLGMTSDLAEEETLKKPIDVGMESLNGSMLKEGLKYEKIGSRNGVLVNFVENEILPSMSFVQGQATDEAKVVNGLSNIEIEAESNIPISNEMERETKPTLDRINLESWEGNSNSKSRAKDEKNLVLALFKAFMSAFNQFWSDFSRV